MKTKEQKKEQAKKLIDVLAYHVSSVQKLIACIEYLSQEEKDEKGYHPTICSISIDNTFDGEASIQCHGCGSIIDYTDIQKHRNDDEHNERYKMVNGIKFFELCD